MEHWLGLSLAPILPRHRAHIARHFLATGQWLPFQSPKVSAHIDAALAWSEAPQHHLVTLNDPMYPPLLREIYDPPVLLYVKGRRQALVRESVALFGSRHPPSLALAQTRSLALDLVEAKWQVVSGLALGIDAMAHRSALHAQGHTLAWMPCGLGSVYPKRHAPLVAKMIREGAIVSEFPLHAWVRRHHFVQRNRLITGMCAHAFLMAAQLKSGSMISARYAIEQNRELWVGSMVKGYQALEGAKRYAWDAKGRRGLPFTHDPRLHVCAQSDDP